MKPMNQKILTQPQREIKQIIDKYLDEAVYRYNELYYPENFSVTKKLMTDDLLSYLDEHFFEKEESNVEHSH